jgi:tRNA (cytidine/uridine-2'-O-)-methyltransferase
MQVALVEPEIPPNTGNIARTCAATGTRLHLVHPLGFEISDKQLKRAGLDYWPHVDLREHESLGDCLEAAGGGRRAWYLSKKADRSLYQAEFRPGDLLVFGPETRGLPEPLLEEVGARALRIPMRGDAVRSLNLGNAVAITLYEALRQTGGWA